MASGIDGIEGIALIFLIVGSIIYQLFFNPQGPKHNLRDNPREMLRHLGPKRLHEEGGSASAPAGGGGKPKSKKELEKELVAKAKRYSDDATQKANSLNEILTNIIDKLQLAVEHIKAGNIRSAISPIQVAIHLYDEVNSVVDALKNIAGAVEQELGAFNEGVLARRLNSAIQSKLLPEVPKLKKALVTAEREIIPILQASVEGRASGAEVEPYLETAITECDRIHLVVQRVVEEIKGDISKIAKDVNDPYR